jgi:hypothetical protein
MSAAEPSVADPDRPSVDVDPLRWPRRVGLLAFVVIGWAFIAWQNRFYVTPPLVFVCLGWLAVVAAVYFLWRTGASAATASVDEGDAAWGQVLGARGELMLEKKTLLKAIKEVEFDFQMGKLSERDSQEMIRVYRARAIEVIKALDQPAGGAAGSVRDQIEREVRARLEVDGKSKKKAAERADKLKAEAAAKDAVAATSAPAPVETNAPSAPAASAPATGGATAYRKSGKSKKGKGGAKAGAPAAAATAPAVASTAAAAAPPGPATEAAVAADAGADDDDDANDVAAPTADRAPSSEVAAGAPTTIPVTPDDRKEATP